MSILLTLQSRCFSISFSLQGRCLYILSLLQGRCFYILLSSLLDRCFSILPTPQSRCFAITSSLEGRCLYMGVLSTGSLLRHTSLSVHRCFSISPRLSDLCILSSLSGRSLLITLLVISSSPSGRCVCFSLCPLFLNIAFLIWWSLNLNALSALSSSQYISHSVGSVFISIPLFLRSPCFSITLQL